MNKVSKKSLFAPVLGKEGSAVTFSDVSNCLDGVLDGFTNINSKHNVSHDMKIC